MNRAELEDLAGCVLGIAVFGGLAALIGASSSWVVASSVVGAVVGMRLSYWMFKDD